MGIISWLLGNTEEQTPPECMISKLSVYRVGLTSMYSMHGAQARIRTVSASPDIVIMSSFTTDFPHTGARKSFMVRLCKIADECGMSIRLHPSVISSDLMQLPVDADTIVGWFAGFGFRPTVKHGLQRKPNKNTPKQSAEPEQEFDIDIELEDGKKSISKIKLR